MLYTPRNDHDVALAADPLFAAEAELHLSLEHPDDLLIGVTVRLDMDTGPDAPPYDHPLSAGDHDVALAADPLFAAEAELHLPLEHPDDLLIGVTVRLDMDTGPDAPPYDHPLAAGEDAAADLFAELLV